VGWGLASGTVAAFSGGLAVFSLKGFFLLVLAGIRVFANAVGIVSMSPSSSLIAILHVFIC
jgi:hypothetical protein